MVLAGVLAEGDQSRLIGLDEAGQPRDTLLLGVESAIPEPVRGDEYQRSGHEAPSSRSCGWLPPFHAPWLSMIVAGGFPARRASTR